MCVYIVLLHIITCECSNEHSDSIKCLNLQGQSEWGEVARKKDPVRTVVRVTLKTYVRINASEVLRRTAQKFRNINTTMNYTFSILSYLKVGRDSSVGIATRYGLVGPGIETRWGEICRTRPDRP